jgi:transaldolase
LPNDPRDKYVAELAGSDIQTNPPKTNAAVQAMAGKTFSRKVDQMPPQPVLDEVDRDVDFQQLESVLMKEGLKKFSDPHKTLLALIHEKRASVLESKQPVHA